MPDHAQHVSRIEFRKNRHDQSENRKAMGDDQYGTVVEKRRATWREPLNVVERSHKADGVPDHAQCVSRTEFRKKRHGQSENRKAMVHDASDTLVEKLCDETADVQHRDNFGMKRQDDLSSYGKNKPRWRRIITSTDGSDDELHLQFCLTAADPLQSLNTTDCTSDCQQLKVSWPSLKRIAKTL